MGSFEEMMSDYETDDPDALLGYLGIMGDLQDARLEEEINRETLMHKRRLKMKQLLFYGITQNIKVIHKYGVILDNEQNIQDKLIIAKQMKIYTDLVVSTLEALEKEFGGPNFQYDESFNANENQQPDQFPF